jgi:hypothetical protein
MTEQYENTVKNDFSNQWFTFQVHANKNNNG